MNNQYGISKILKILAPMKRPIALPTETKNKSLNYKIIIKKNFIV